jgi:hypothetical protein
LPLSPRLYLEAESSQMNAANIHGRMARGFLEYRYGPPCPALLRPAGGPPLKRPNSCFRGGPPAEQAACGRLLSLWTPHAVRLCYQPRGGTVFPGGLSMAECRSTTTTTTTTNRGQTFFIMSFVIFQLRCWGRLPLLQLMLL